MKTVDGILSNFTKTITKLEKVADKNQAKAVRISARRHALAQRETKHLNEVAYANTVAKRISSLIGGA